MVTGGGTREGVYVEPTIVDEVARDSCLFREEIFGPVLSVTPFDTLDEALELANDTAYGLDASAYTGNLRNAIKLARGIRAGIVTVNCFGEGDASPPRQLQGVGLRPARQVALGPRPVHRDQDHLDRRVLIAIRPQHCFRRRAVAEAILLTAI